MRASQREQDEIRVYVEGQADERVVHLERAASELVGPVRHDIWDVHCEESRWWVLTSPTNLYSQADFKSRDVVLTFHVGLTLRMSYMQDREMPVAPTQAEMLPGSWRRWQQAFDVYDGGDEAATFQAVGMHLRECLLSFIDETRADDLVPRGSQRPKDADFRGWVELLANSLAAGESVAKLRSYLKKTQRIAVGGPLVSEQPNRWSAQRDQRRCLMTMWSRTPRSRFSSFRLSWGDMNGWLPTDEDARGQWHTANAIVHHIDSIGRMYMGVTCNGTKGLRRASTDWAEHALNDLVKPRRDVRRIRLSVPL